MGYSCYQCYRVCLFPGIGWGMVAISAIEYVCFQVSDGVWLQSVL